ncbi:MAG: hypothetical protein ACTSRR_03770 [Candidatus Heimdallarchaeaceae archaeon]
MASFLGQMIVSLLPLLVFLGLYIGFFIWGRFANKKIKEQRLDDVLTALELYNDNYVRKDPNDRQIELRLQLKDEFQVKSASAWIILLPRTSFPTMFVDKLFFKNKDSFGLAANFHHKPRVVFELIPYKLKSAIRRDFDYLIELDDINTKDEEINNKFLIKSNKPQVIGQFIRSKSFMNILRKYHNEIQWLSVRTDSPHFEMKFNFPKENIDLLQLVKFCFLSLKFFGKVTESTKNQPIPVIIPPKKLTEKEKAKREKERQKEKERIIKEQREKEKKEMKKKKNQNLNQKTKTSAKKKTKK